MMVRKRCNTEYTKGSTRMGKNGSGIFWVCFTTNLLQLSEFKYLRVSVYTTNDILGNKCTAREWI